MKNAQKPDHVSLGTLIARLREGHYVIPDFQREFVWEPRDIRDLVRSVFLDYYIGSLLLWKGKKENFNALSCEQVYGFSGESKKPEYIVLDGQQRLTALYYAFLAPDISLPNRSNRAVYFARVDKFMNGEYDDAFHYEWQPRRVEKILDDRKAQFKKHIFPLSIIGATGWELAQWGLGYQQYWKNVMGTARADGDHEAVRKAEEHAANAEQFGIHLRDVTEQYQISYVELDQDLELDKVCDIFTQINSRGVRLDVFDLINALLKPEGVKLKHMWRTDRERLEFVQAGRMNVYILQVMSILKQTYCSPKYLYFLLPGTCRGMSSVGVM